MQLHLGFCDGFEPLGRKMKLVKIISEESIFSGSVSINYVYMFLLEYLFSFTDKKPPHLTSFGFFMYSTSVQ